MNSHTCISLRLEGSPILIAEKPFEGRIFPPVGSEIVVGDNAFKVERVRWDLELDVVFVDLEPEPYDPEHTPVIESALRAAGFEVAEESD